MKVFKYIFKKKLLITITILLLLVESLCTFITPYICSIIIDYGVKQNGIVFAVPLQLDPYSFRASERCLDSNEDKQLMINSYDVKYVDDPIYEGDEEKFYYEINLNGVLNIQKIEQLWIPLCAFVTQVNNPDYNIDNLGVPDIEDVNIDLLNQVKDGIKEVIKNTSYDEMYKIAIEEKIIENSFMGINKDTYQVAFLNIVSALMVLVVFIYLIVTIIGTYLASKISFTISKELRRKQFEKVMTFSSHDMDKFSRASLITRATNDLQVIQNTSVFVIRAIMIAPVSLIVGFLMAYFTAPSMVWLIALAIAVILLLSAFLILIVLPRYRIIQKLVDKINSVARESISGVSIIRALNNEKFQEERFSEVNKKLYKNMLFATSMLIVAMPILMLIVNILSVSILWIGSFQLQVGEVNIGQLIAFTSYASEAIFALFFIAAGFIMLPRADVSIGRVEEVLNHKLKIDNFKQKTKLSNDITNKDEYIKFENVSFNFDEDNNKLFRNLNIDIKKNSINAIVGPTGSGKSTLLKLLLRYYDVDSGKISIDGVDVKDFNEKDLRNTLSYVPQKVNLFYGTLEENVALNTSIPRNAKLAEKSLRMVNMGDFIDSNKEKMNYVVRQGARNLSGGQKQRISIARSIYEDSPIMLLDDPFSALDANTEKIINTSLQKDFNNTTILVVTQRLSSVVDYDNIIFINEGKVEASGTHKDLMKNSKKYKEAFEKAKAPTIEDMR